MKLLSFLFAGLSLVLLNQCVKFDPIECSTDISCKEEPCIGYDTDVDSVGHKFIPGELIVEFTEWASSGTKKLSTEVLVDLNKDIGTLLSPSEKKLAVIDSCLCDKNLFLYKNPAIIGKESEVASKAKKGKTGGEGDVLLNYLIEKDDVEIPSFIVSSEVENNNSLSNKTNTNSTASVIAILDSGIDASRIPDNSVYQNPSDDLCLGSADPYGWNFVSDNSNVLDDNGHGTLVALSYFDALDILTNVAPSDQKLLTVKILNQCGEGTVFDAACGLYYADEKGADVINNSWGLYTSSALLEKVIQEISDSTLNVCSAGNQTKELSTITHIPSEYSQKYNSVFEVGALCKSMQDDCTSDVNLLLLSSNFRDGMMIEDGRNAQRLLSNSNLSCSISGTSFAAPRFSAALIRELKANNTVTNSTFRTNTYKLPVFNYFSYVREHCR